MFCHKCGNQVMEGSDFCNKCGAKLIAGSPDSQAVEKDRYQTQDSSPRESAYTDYMPAISPNSAASDIEKFKAYVDNYVNMNTKFQSATELLKKSKPQTFLWFCFGIPVIIGLFIGGPLGALLLGLFCGHIARLIVGGITRTKYILKTSSRFDVDIDTSDLLRFLNEHLSYLNPYFHEGTCDDKNLRIPFGENKRSVAIINIIPNENKSYPEKWEYMFNAQA